MSAIETLIERLRAAGITGEWYNSGGGCMLVRVETPDGGEILIGDRDDSFGYPDLESDEHVSGFGSAHYPPGYQEWHDTFVDVHRTEDDPTEPRWEDFPYTEAGEAEYERATAAWKAGHLVRAAWDCADAVAAKYRSIRPEPRKTMMGKQIIAVASADLPDGRMETRVVTWDRQSGSESWTFIESPARDADGRPVLPEPTVNVAPHEGGDQ